MRYDKRTLPGRSSPINLSETKQKVGCKLYKLPRYYSLLKSVKVSSAKYRLP